MNFPMSVNDIKTGIAKDTRQVVKEEIKINWRHETIIGVNV